MMRSMAGDLFLGNLSCSLSSPVGRRKGMSASQSEAAFSFARLANIYRMSISFSAYVWVLDTQMNTAWSLFWRNF